jgi:hypothetical protein
VLLVPVEGIPEPEVAVKSERVGDRHVLARGEATGHAHVAVGRALRLVAWSRSRRWTTPDRRTYLVVNAGDEATLVHEEHLPISLPTGAFEVRRQREYRADGWTQVAD